ncbi:MAG: glycine--tRNA ligase subunit beta [Burkholderiales bacterium]
MSNNTSAAQNLLVELLTEELPPKALRKLGEAFASGIRGGLMQAGLCPADAPMQVFATPRRLGVLLRDVAAIAKDRAESKKLMPAKVAFDATGAATAALEKRLQKEGATSDQVVRRVEGNDEVVYLDFVVKGESLRAALQRVLVDSLAKLPIPKVMTYQLADGVTDVQFVRPAHGLVAMHGADVVPVSVLGLQAGNVTQGHRFQGETKLTLTHADEYQAVLLQRGGVVASFDERRTEIERLLRLRAEACGDTLGARETYEALLDEVTALVEMPTVYVGQFEQEFLEVPAECLILTMKLNQKYFPLFLASDDSNAGLSSRFLIVSNMRLDDPRNVIEGNQRVVRPRLSDARFFFETDKKTKLVDRLPKLASVVYHNKLGSQGERMARVAKLAADVAKQIGANVEQAVRAAQLAKADLVTDMVGEFPELQGTMGRYYALHDGEPAVVADAIAEHYQPRFAGDALPQTDVAIALALADKMETLAGLFSIGQEPTGDKDPFALRRHALGVLRMLIERNLPLSVRELVDAAYALFPAAQEGAADRLTEYIFDRLVGYLRDLGYSTLEVDAVVSVLPSRWGELPVRLAAVRAFTQLPEATSLAAANKRIGNILKKAEGEFAVPDSNKFVEAAERDLYQALMQTVPVFERHFAANDFSAALQSLAPLKGPVDTFFDQVMVNAEDPVVRANRLGLLASLHREMNRVADLSKLAA